MNSAMIAVLFILSLVVTVLSGILAAAMPLGRRGSSLLGSAGICIGCCIGFASAVSALMSRGAYYVRHEWSLPYASLSIDIDSLSAFFLAVTFLISGLAAIYGKGYLEHHGAHGVGMSWFLYSMLVAGMALVISAANGVLFIIAWEIMTVSSFFLVTSDDEDEQVRKAGLLYLVASHVGVSLLFIMFWILTAKTGGSMDFDSFQRAVDLSPSMKGVLFLLAVAGFGVKAGFMPLHIWLPEAHPAAPSHVSALMSGVMIKTGIYGLLRVMTFLGQPPIWWGCVLITIGLVSGVLGVLFALAQHDIKRLLAFSSVENIGVIAIGLGMGTLGFALGDSSITALGFIGGILHVYNHALFKSLLFMGAGGVLSETGERRIDRLGGLGKRMPVTSTTFLCGSVSVCGLPPLNGFVSELLIYIAAFQGILRLPGAGAALSLAALVGLALIGGLAVACFTKIYGMVFLGEPRVGSVTASESGALMLIPQIILSIACIVSGLFPFFAIWAAASAAGMVVWMPNQLLDREFWSLIAVFLGVYKVVLLFAVLLTALAILRSILMSARRVTRSGTWDCGYAAPSARMQYTSSSYAQQIVDFAFGVLRTRKTLTSPSGIFPKQASFESKTPDVFTRWVARPIYDLAWKSTLLTRGIQSGNTHLYILYIAVALLVALLYRRFFG